MKSARNLRYSGLPRPAHFLRALIAAILFLCAARSFSADTEWLVVADTSFSMRRRQENSLAIARELFSDQFNHLLRPGDAIGIWTFKDQLFTNEFPILSWKAEKHAEISDSALAFLRDQKFGRRTRLGPVITALQNEAFKHKTLAVFLITDGDDKIAGTPFDGALNGDYMLYGSYFRKGNRPFLTMLIFQKGYCVAARVHPGKGNISIPLARAAQFAAAEPGESAGSNTGPKLDASVEAPAVQDAPLTNAASNIQAPMVDPGPKIEKEGAPPPQISKAATNAAVASEPPAAVETPPEVEPKQDNKQPALPAPVQIATTNKSETPAPAKSSHQAGPNPDLNDLDVMEPKLPEVPEILMSETGGGPGSNEPSEKKQGVKPLVIGAAGLVCLALLSFFWVKRSDRTSLISQSFTKR